MVDRPLVEWCVDAKAVCACMSLESFAPRKVVDGSFVPATAHLASGTADVRPRNVGARPSRTCSIKSWFNPSLFSEPSDGSWFILSSSSRNRTMERGTVRSLDSPEARHRVPASRHFVQLGDRASHYDIDQTRSYLRIVCCHSGGTLPLSSLSCTVHMLLPSDEPLMKMP